MARAMASGQESTSISLLSFRRAIVERQRIFFSCSTSTLGSTPHRSAAETTRHVASLCEGHPPAFPRLANTSQRPFSSLLTLMKSVPQPVLDFMVWPVVLWGLGRGDKQQPLPGKGVGLAGALIKTSADLVSSKRDPGVLERLYVRSAIPQKENTTRRKKEM